MKLVVKYAKNEGEALKRAKLFFERKNIYTTCKNRDSTAGRLLTLLLLLFISARKIQRKDSFSKE